MSNILFFINGNLEIKKEEETTENLIDLFVYHMRFLVETKKKTNIRIEFIDHANNQITFNDEIYVPQEVQFLLLQDLLLLPVERARQFPLRHKVFENDN